MDYAHDDTKPMPHTVVDGDGDHFMFDTRVWNILYEGVAIDFCNMVYHTNGNTQLCVLVLTNLMRRINMTKVVIVYKHGYFRHINGNLPFEDLAIDVATQLALKFNGTINLLCVDVHHKLMRDCLNYLRRAYYGSQQELYMLQDILRVYGTNIIDLAKARDDFIVMSLDMAWFSNDRYNKVELDFMKSMLSLPMNLDSGMEIPSVIKDNADFVKHFTQLDVVHNVVYASSASTTSMQCLGTYCVDICNQDKPMQIPLQTLNNVVSSTVLHTCRTDEELASLHEVHRILMNVIV